MSATKSIWVEWRGPETKAEKALFGQTVWTNPNTVKIFINIQKNKQAIDLFKTFWHEMAHVFFKFHKSKRSSREQEDMCYRVEKVLWELLR